MRENQWTEIVVLLRWRLGVHHRISVLDLGGGKCEKGVWAPKEYGKLLLNRLAFLQCRVALNLWYKMQPRYGTRPRFALLFWPGMASRGYINEDRILVDWPVPDLPATVQQEGGWHVKKNHGFCGKYISLRTRQQQLITVAAFSLLIQPPKRTFF